MDGLKKENGSIRRGYVPPLNTKSLFVKLLKKANPSLKLFSTTTPI